MGRIPPECCPEQSIDLRPGLTARQAVVELELHESHQQRVERASGRQQLLRNLRKRLARGDHWGQRRELAARALSVSHGGAAIARCPDSHGVTNAAPVMPAAACPGKEQVNVCVPA